jgi:hypothetical protein
MIARGRDTGLPVLAATTSAQIAADLADQVNVVVALPGADAATANGDDGTAGSGVPSVPRAGEFRLAVKDPPRLVAHGRLVRGWEGT